MVWPYFQQFLDETLPRQVPRTFPKLPAQLLQARHAQLLMLLPSVEEIACVHKIKKPYTGHLSYIGMSARKQRQQATHELTRNTVLVFVKN